MGVGLIVEGILSAFYHVCPTRHNYQFGILNSTIKYQLLQLKFYYVNRYVFHVRDCGIVHLETVPCKGKKLKDFKHVYHR